jgi:mannose/fructose/N-acetylgalactosamine-specific phosphotransferase system component IIC
MDAASGGAAVWWWAGILVLLLVVIPVVLLLVQRVLRHISEIKHYAEDVLEHGLAIAGNLEPVPALAETRELVKRVGGGLGDYVASVDRLL